jgi:transposase
MMGQRKFNMKTHHNLCLDDLVSPNDLYRKIDGLIDFSFIYELAKESYSHTGQPSLDPAVFFKIELVGFLEGIHEDRALERRIKDSLAIRWFLGYDLDDPLPVHSTISRTRKERISKVIYQAVFDHMLGLCIRHQLVKGNHQSIDSTLLKANASLDSLEVLQPKVLAHYEKAVGVNHSESKDKYSESASSKSLRRDQEAQATKKPGFLGAAYYKASAGVDEACGIITHAQVDDGNKNDAELLKPIVTTLKDRLSKNGFCFQSVATDKGYYSAENLKFLNDEELIAHIPPRLQPNNTGGFDRHKFRYHPDKDEFTCPEGKVLKFRQLSAGWPHLKKYRSREKDCRLCPQKPFCTPGNARTLQRSIHDDLIQIALERAKSKEGIEASLRRQIQAEGTFANLKGVLKFKKLYSLGLESARKRFLMGCAVVNLKKLIRFLCCFRLFFSQILYSFKEQTKFRFGLSVL